MVEVVVPVVVSPVVVDTDTVVLVVVVETAIRIPYLGAPVFKVLVAVAEAADLLLVIHQYFRQQLATMDLTATEQLLVTLVIPVHQVTMDPMAMGQLLVIQVTLVAAVVLAIPAPVLPTVIQETPVQLVTQVLQVLLQ